MATLKFWVNAVGCWEWLGTRNADGYGIVCVGESRQRAHRVAYEQYVGPIPDGLVIDHLCSNRACINPKHLEPVAQAENARRGASGRDRTRTECKNGHAFVDGSYSMMRGGTKRRYMVKRCLICNRERERARRAA